MSVYENLKEKGIHLPQQLAAAGLYKPVSQFGKYLYVSGQGSMQGDTHICGTLGKNITVEEGVQAARLSAINTLSALQAYTGDLTKIKQCVKILGFVASTSDFTDQAKVINGASQLFIDAFGEAGKHARSAIGSVALPLGLAVEVESIWELKEV